MSDIEGWDALAAVFGTLGRLHREPPDDALLDALTALLDQWPLADTEEAQLGVQRLRRSRELGEDAETIRRDHDRMYGVSATAVVPPYESVHRGTDGLVFDEQTLAVRDAYRSLGLSAPRLNREPDDHIGLEFDFVAQALVMALDADEAGTADPQVPVQAARDFVRDHLATWAPQMLQVLEERAATEFVRGLAALSRGALRSADTILAGS